MMELNNSGLNLIEHNTVSSSPMALDEAQRLAVLRAYEILDTQPEEPFDDITQLASQICQTPIALISLLDEARQWFKSKVGVEMDQTPRNISFCTHAIKGDDVMEVKNAHEDDRFKNSPLVTGDPNICFYAGMPLTTEMGHKLGTLCVIDQKPRELTAEQRLSLTRLAKLVVEQIELKHTRSLLMKERMRQEMILNSVAEGLHALDIDGNIIFENVASEKMLGYRKGELIGKKSHATIHHHLANGEYYPILHSPIYTTLRDGQTRSVENEVFWRKDGTSFPVEYVVSGITTPKGEQVGAIVAFHDASRYIKAQQSHALLASIVEASRDAIIGQNLFGDVIRWNAGAERMFGRTSAEMLGKSVSLIFPDCIWHDITLLLNLVTKGSQVEPFETSGITKSGEIVKLSVAFSPIKNKDGKVVGVSNVTREIMPKNENAFADVDSASL